MKGDVYMSMPKIKIRNVLTTSYLGVTYNTIKAEQV